MLAVDGDMPTRLKVSWMSSTGTTVMQLPDSPTDESPLAQPLLGRSMLFARDGDQWQPRLVGGKPTAEQSAGIQGVGNPGPEDVVPAGDASLGDSWTLGGGRLRQWFGLVAEGVTGIMQVHFEQVVDYNSQPCALLAVEVDASGRLPLADGTTIQVSLAGEGLVWQWNGGRTSLRTVVTWR